MKKALLAVLFCCMGVSTQAQHSAPGMPMQLPRRATPSSPVKTKPTPPAGASPAKMVVPSPVFPRFWHQAEPILSQEKRTYYLFQQQHIKYPVTSLRAGIGGSISALLTVLPDGKVGAVRITRRVMDEAAASIDAPSLAAEAALDAEVIRVVSQMRFEPAAITADTVTVSQRFLFQ